MKSLYLICLNYFLVVFFAILDQWRILAPFKGALGSYFFYDIPNSFNSTIGFHSNRPELIIIVICLSFFPFLMGKIKNNKIILFLMIIYFVVETWVISFISFMSGV